MLIRAIFVSVLVVCIRSDELSRKVSTKKVRAFENEGICTNEKFDEVFKDYNAESLRSKVIRRCECKIAKNPTIFQNNNTNPMSVVAQTGEIEEIKFMWKIPNRYSEVEKKIIKNEMDSVICMFMRLSPVILTETDSVSDAKIILKPKLKNKVLPGHISSGEGNVLWIKNDKCGNWKNNTFKSMFRNKPSYNPVPLKFILAHGIGRFLGLKTSTNKSSFMYGTPTKLNIKKFTSTVKNQNVRIMTEFDKKYIMSLYNKINPEMYNKKRLPRMLKQVGSVMLKRATELGICEKWFGDELENGSWDTVKKTTTTQRTTTESVNATLPIDDYASDNSYTVSDDDYWRGGVYFNATVSTLE